MKTIKKIRWFSIQAMNTQIDVRFRAYNNVIVYCDIRYTFPDFNIWDEVLTTSAKLHPDDLFDFKLGCEIAYARAFKQLWSVYNQEKNKEIKRLKHQEQYLIEAISKRFNKYLRRVK